jgi:CRISPR/Cas system-associated endoribonuclease Cas2
MTPKQIFTNSLYELTKSAIQRIPDSQSNDVYVCEIAINSDFVHSEMCDYESNLDFELLLSYNTNAAWEKQQKLFLEYFNLDKKKRLTKRDRYLMQRAKWLHYRVADWEEITIKTSCSTDENYLSWLQNSAYYLSYNQIQELKLKTNLSDMHKIIKKIQKNDYHFAEKQFAKEVVKIVRRLFKEKIIEQKFGKEIPIIIGYLEDVIHRKSLSAACTEQANPQGLADEYLETIKEQSIML